jgi:hypothetical protein
MAFYSVKLVRRSEDAVARTSHGTRKVEIRPALAQANLGRYYLSGRLSAVVGWFLFGLARFPCL